VVLCDVFGGPAVAGVGSIASGSAYPISISIYGKKKLKKQEAKKKKKTPKC